MPYGRSKAAAQRSKFKCPSGVQGSRFKTIIATVPITGTVAISMMENLNGVSYQARND